MGGNGMTRAARMKRQADQEAAEYRRNLGLALGPDILAIWDAEDEAFQAALLPPRKSVPFASLPLSEREEIIARDDWRWDEETNDREWGRWEEPVMEADEHEDCEEDR